MYAIVCVCVKACVHVCLCMRVYAFECISYMYKHTNTQTHIYGDMYMCV